MVRLRKQVTTLKIQHFFENNKCVLFFHNKKKSDYTLEQAHIEFSRKLLGTDVENILTSFSIKNKIAQRVIHASECNAHLCVTACVGRSYKVYVRNEHQGQRHEETRRMDKVSFSNCVIEGLNPSDGVEIALGAGLLKNSSSKHVTKGVPSQRVNCYAHADGRRAKMQKGVAATAFNDAFSPGPRSAILKPLQDALFQGPIMLLGINDLTRLQDVTSHYRQQFILLGGCYEKKRLNNDQLEKLSMLGQKADRSLHLDLSTCLQQPALQTLCNIKSFLCLPTLFCSLEYRLIALLNHRSETLSAR